MIKGPLYFPGSLGATCPTGYEPIDDATTCTAAVAALGLPAALYDCSQPGRCSDGLHQIDMEHVKLPKGCAITTSSGRGAAASIATVNARGGGLFDWGSKVSTDTFMVCARKKDHDCFPVGSKCSTEFFKNYTWQKDGSCQGTCDWKGSGGDCMAGARCCAGTCVPAAMLTDLGQCPGQKQIDKLLDYMAQQVTQASPASTAPPASGT